jgi:hypothetical protein
MRKILFSFLSVYLGVEEDVGIPGVELPVVLLAVGHRAEILTAEITFTMVPVMSIFIAEILTGEISFTMVPFYEYLHS